MEVYAACPKADSNQIDPGASDGSRQTTYLPGLFDVERLERIDRRRPGFFPHRPHFYDDSLSADQGNDVKLSPTNRDIARDNLHTLPSKHPNSEIFGVLTKFRSCELHE